MEYIEVAGFSGLTTLSCEWEKCPAHDGKIATRIPAVQAVCTSVLSCCWCHVHAIVPIVNIRQTTWSYVQSSSSIGRATGPSVLTTPSPPHCSRATPTSSPCRVLRSLLHESPGVAVRARAITEHHRFLSCRRRALPPPAARVIPRRPPLPTSHPLVSTAAPYSFSLVPPGPSPPLPLSCRSLEQCHRPEPDVPCYAIHPPRTSPPCHFPLPLWATEPPTELFRGAVAWTCVFLIHGN
jgi:hypothetical protein